MNAGWQTKPLGEVCTLQRGFDLPTHDRKKGRFPLVSSSGISDSHDEGPVLSPGVVTGRSGSIGSVFYIEDAFWPLNTTLYVRDFHGNLPRFVYYLLVAFDLKKYAGGTGVPTLNRNDVHGVPVIVPGELPEQQRIVTLLDEAFDGIATAKAHAEKNLQNAQAIFASHLHSVFKGRGDGWVEMSLGQVGKVSMCKRIFKEETKATGDIPFYKIGTFGKEADSFIPSETYRKYRDKYPFPNKGDVLISAAGTIGRRVIYDGEQAYFQDSNIVWIANDQSQLLNHYLYHFYGVCEWNSRRASS
jgi:type I restriction enzyme S subunit